MTDTEFRDAMKRASGSFDTVGRATPVKASIATEIAMVEMMVHNVRDGDLRPASFLQHPAHLPEGEELRVLLVGTVPKDATLRADAHEWASVNRVQAATAAVSLRNAITAIRMANDLLNDPDVDEQLYDWMTEIATYVRTVFACDPDRAPHERADLDAWCATIANRANPCPKWLQEWRPQNKPAPASLAEQFAEHMSRKGDD